MLLSDPFLSVVSDNRDFNDNKCHKYELKVLYKHQVCNFLLWIEVTVPYASVGSDIV